MQFGFIRQKAKTYILTTCIKFSQIQIRAKIRLIADCYSHKEERSFCFIQLQPEESMHLAELHPGSSLRKLTVK